MKLADYLKTLNPQQRGRLARRCGTSTEYLQQIATGIRVPKVKLAVAISRESDGVVTCEEILPDVDWKFLRARPRDTTEAAA